MRNEKPDTGQFVQPTEYQPPTIERLGTLAELTLGGLLGIDDGMGGSSGDVGSA